MLDSPLCGSSGPQGAIEIHDRIKRNAMSRTIAACSTRVETSGAGRAYVLGLCGFSMGAGTAPWIVAELVAQLLSHLHGVGARAVALVDERHAGHVVALVSLR